MITYSKMPEYAFYDILLDGGPAGNAVVSWYSHPLAFMTDRYVRVWLIADNRLWNIAGIQQDEAEWPGFAEQRINTLDNDQAEGMIRELLAGMVPDHARALTEISLRRQIFNIEIDWILPKRRLLFLHDYYIRPAGRQVILLPEHETCNYPLSIPDSEIVLEWYTRFAGED